MGRSASLRRPTTQTLYAHMNTGSYKVKGNKAALNKLVFYWLFLGAWYFIQSPLHSLITGCSIKSNACTSEQINALLKLQSFSHLPTALFFVYVGYYSSKVIIQKQIPPTGNAFPFSIPAVTYRDHYAFGITGIIMAIIAIIAVTKVIYFAFTINSI